MLPGPGSNVKGRAFYWGVDAFGWVRKEQKELREFDFYLELIDPNKECPLSRPAGRNCSYQSLSSPIERENS